MTQLRWVLLALGVLIILAVYLRSRGLASKLFAAFDRRGRPRAAPNNRRDPFLGDEDNLDHPPLPAGGEVGTDEYDEEPGTTPSGRASQPTSEQPDPASLPVESVVTLRLIPRERRMSSNKVIIALRAAGLRHGRYGIFHRHASDLDEEPLFSVASLTEPGSFDLARLTETTIAGVSLFMVLPGTGDPVDRFDKMVATARELARKLNAELHDEKGSSWSIQRERYIREEVIEYRHSLERLKSE